MIKYCLHINFECFPDISLIRCKSKTSLLVCWRLSHVDSPQAWLSSSNDNVEIYKLLHIVIFALLNMLTHQIGTIRLLVQVIASPTLSGATSMVIHDATTNVLNYNEAMQNSGDQVRVCVCLCEYVCACAYLYAC